jgi:hypothetical protein
LSFFELLFYFLILFGVPVLISVFRQMAKRRRRSAWKTLRVYLILVAIYAGALIATTLALPIEVIPSTEPQFSGDWSVAVASLRRFPHDLDEDYEVDFRMSNRSKSPIYGPKNLSVYLLSENGTRYDPAPDPSDPPFDTEIKPGKSVTTTRKFVLPTNLYRVELVIARKGFRLGWFIIGRSPFDGRTVLVLQ